MALCSENATVLSIDPGSSETGWAFWTRGELFQAGLARLPATWRLRTTPERMAAMCAELRRQCTWTPNAVVIELPRVRNVGSRGSKGDPNDIVHLALLVGALAQDWRECRVLLATPEEWKGQTPKDISVQRSKGSISPSELQRVMLPSAESVAHNVWDAIGIGLWAIGR